ncbi:ROK family protein [Phytoactinopolyspora sp. XMNu-373]|uniref:fructokinase n=1 Tax=Phytoactinopolyspora mesophila TaxID=2650750 RepID=A0A7K3M9S2_9ACTN|nr:ROK family protein [Phytoactinopolyspora mesophila]
MMASIEAGGTKFVCAVGTGPHDLRAVTSFPTTTPDETLAQAIAFVREQEELAGQSVSALGVACFGPVDLRTDSPTFGHITSTPKPGWGGTDVVGTFRQALGVPVGFDTDVNGAALAESRWGAGQGLDPVVYVTVGTGIGAGALVNRQLLHGLLHPEVGHVLVRRHPEDTFEGVCPYHGDCLEGLAAGPALQARWQRRPADLGPLRDQAVAMESWYLAQLATMLMYLLSPERIVFGGGVTKLPGLLPALRKDAVSIVNGYIDAPAATTDIDSYIVPPGLGDQAGILGGLALAQRAVSR